jgi:plastocyanin
MSGNLQTGRRAPRFRDLALAALIVSGGGLLVGVGAPAWATAAASGPTVKIDNFTFGPAALTVKVGTTVTWVNHDDIPHAVVSDDHTSFKSKVLDTDQSFAFTFTKAGEYPYFCSLHPHMVGKVVVQN